VAQGVGPEFKLQYCKKKKKYLLSINIDHRIPSNLKRSKEMNELGTMRLRQMCCVVDVILT
jgi:hypothetical protein